MKTPEQFLEELKNHCAFEADFHSIKGRMIKAEAYQEILSMLEQFQEEQKRNNTFENEIEQIKAYFRRPRLERYRENLLFWLEHFESNLHTLNVANRAGTEEYIAFLKDELQHVEQKLKQKQVKDDQ